MVLNVKTETYLIIGLVIKKRRGGFLPPTKKQLLNKLMKVVGCSTITEQSVLYFFSSYCRWVNEILQPWNSHAIDSSMLSHNWDLLEKNGNVKSMRIKRFSPSNMSTKLYFISGGGFCGFRFAWANRLFRPFGLYLNNDHFIYAEFSV